MKKHLGYCLFANKGYPLERECATARGMRCDLCGFFSHGGEKRMGGRIVQLLNDYNHMKIIQPISALIPWESYDYQGHVALYVTLKKIYELISSSEPLTGYELQIEGEEDFSLLKDSKYISLHQVKAGAVNLKNKDKFTFIIELLENDKADGFFHINSSEKIPKDFCRKAIEHGELILKELNHEVILKKDLKDAKDSTNYIVFEEISPVHEKGSVYSLIKYAVNTMYPSGYDIDQVKSTVVDIVAVLSKYIDEIKDVVADEDISEPDGEYLKVYPECFDTNSEIRNEAIGIIKDILGQIKPEYRTFVNDDYSRFVYDRLFLYMKEKITVHRAKASYLDKCLMRFEDILNVITINYVNELNTKEYQYFQVLRAFVDAYGDYPKKKRTSCSGNNCKDCAEKEACNLNIQIKELLTKDDEIKKDAIRNLIMFEPQKGKNNNLPSDSLISYLLCDVLKEISKMKLNDKAVYQAIRNDLEVYRLTLDESRDQFEIQKKLQRFISNDVDKTLLYETDVLITDRIDNQSLVFNEDRINVLGEKELEELRNNNVSSLSIDKMKKESNRPKVIRVIDKNTAIGELK